MSAPPDPLDDLRAQIRATQEAAERLAGEAAGAARAGIPPQGWRTAQERRASADELAALAALVGSLRDLVPPELRDQLREIVHQLLLLVRALIDWWVERIEEQGDGADGRPDGAGAGAGPQVEDIPVR